MAEHHTPTPWKWHPKDEPNERNGSVYSEQKPGHAYAVAMQPKYVGNVQWSEDAALIVRAVNSHNALVKALEEIAYPIKAMEARLKPDEKINGVMAVALANNAEYLRSIALAALALCEQDR